MMKKALLMITAFALGIAAREKWATIEAAADAHDALDAQLECENTLQNVLNHSRVIRQYDQKTGFSIYHFAAKPQRR